MEADGNDPAEEESTWWGKAVGVSPVRRQRGMGSRTHARQPHVRPWASLEQMLVGARCDGGNVRELSGRFHVLMSTSIEGPRGLEV